MLCTWKLTPELMSQQRARPGPRMMQEAWWQLPNACVWNLGLALEDA